MEITELAPMEEDVIVASRQPASPIHDLLRQITENPAHHGKLMKLATFPLPKEKGKAHQQKQNMTNTYGNTPAISGFEFVVTRAVDNSAEYLGVTFDPNRIREGEYDKFVAVKKQKAHEANERKKAREAEKAANAASENDSDEEARLKAEALEEIRRLEAEEAEVG